MLNTDNLTEVALHSQRPNAMIEEDFSTEIVIETKNETDDNHDHKELISQVDPIESATIDSCSLVLSVWQFLLFLALVVICYCLRRRRLKSHPITPITAVENTLAAELLKINGLLENSRLKIAEMLRRYPEYRNPVTNGHCCNDWFSMLDCIDSLLKWSPLTTMETQIVNLMW